MMYKQQQQQQLSSREKRAMEKMKKREEELLNEAPNISYLRLLQLQKPFLSGSPMNSCSPTSVSSDCSPSSSPFSNGFCSSEDGSGSPYAALPPLLEEAKYQTPSYHYFDGGPSLDDSKSHLNMNGLSQEFVRMNIREETNGGAKMKGLEMDPHGFGFDFGDIDGSLGGNVVPCNVTRDHGSYGGFIDGGFDMQSFQSSPRGVSLSSDDDKCTFNGFQGGGFEKGVCGSMESFLAHNRSNDLCSGSSWYRNQSDFVLEQRKEQGKRWSNEGTHQLQDPFSTNPYLKDALLGSLPYKMDSDGSKGVMDPLSSTRLNVYDPLYKSLLVKARNRAGTNNGVLQSLMSMKGAGEMEAIRCEDSFIIHGKGVNHVSHKGLDTLRGHKKNPFSEIALRNLRGIKPEGCTLHGGICDNGQSLSSYSPLPVASSISSLSEFRGYLYLMAQDQNGCRFLQKIFEEGKKQDVQLIFDEIIDHVVDLMFKPFGNYVIQKLLDVCDERQRLVIVLMVTKEPGQLVPICLNTYGTRVVQKLIETLRTRQQISLVILALKAGVLDLVKDQNGNHVIQRCLNCLSMEDNKFIFDAAANFCVDIATHRHGCCVMQRCIAHAVGKQRDKLLNKVSRNGLLLAQDPFGNYVVQYIMDLKSPSTITILLSQLKGQYVHLSMQKFGSHVVERCLRQFEESRPQIVRELLSVPHFEQLLQDPYANYVIQSALAFTKGALHSSLVEAVQPHMVLRTSPYCKRIFSRNLLKK